MKKNASHAEQRRELRSLGAMAGGGVILFFCVQMLIGFIISATPLLELYDNNMSVRYAFSCLASVLSVGGSFWLIRVLEDRLFGIRFHFPLRPNRTLPFILSIPAGFALCLSANYVSAFVGRITESAGVELTQPEDLLPTDPAGFLVYAISVVVIPPLVEEFAIRGIVMQPLLKYGRGFAVVASALVFGMMHGNPKQMVFAFVSGLAIGYFVVQTDSLLTGVCIHLFNNAFAVANSYMVQAGASRAAGISMAVVVGIGVVCLIAFLILGWSSGRENSHARGGRWRYFVNIGFLAAAALMALNASQYIQAAG